MIEIVTQTLLEPLTLTEAKTWLREDGDSTELNAEINGLVRTARIHAEGIIGKVTKRQSFKLTLDYWPCRSYIQLPVWKVDSVTAVNYRDTAEVMQTLDSSSYLLDGANSRVVLKFGRTWPGAILSPSGAVTVEFLAGDDAASYPSGLVLFVKQAIAHWYRNREAVTLGNSAVDSKLLAMGAYNLIENDPGPFRRYA